MGNLQIPGEDKKMTSRSCRIHSVSRGIDNFDSSQVRRIKDGTKRGVGGKPVFLNHPFLKGDSLNRLCRSTVISYPSRIESSRFSYGVFATPLRSKLSSTPGSDLSQRGVLSVSIIVCYQHLNIYGSRLC